VTLGLIIKTYLPNPREDLRMSERSKSNKDVIEDLAQQTATPVELVKDLYEDEVNKLRAGATVDDFIGILASQRVKRKLRGRRRGASRRS
jgi:Protein of unknown function (DUF3562)